MNVRYGLEFTRTNLTLSVKLMLRPLSLES